MGNKSELQIHNLDLQSILQAVNSQPTAVPWGGATDIIAGTQDIVIPAYTDTQLTVKGDADLIASNIKKGIELFGVTGTLEEGVSGIDYGTVVSTGKSVTVQHSLGKVPKWAMLVFAGEIKGTVTTYLSDAAIKAIFNAGTELSYKNIAPAYYALSVSEYTGFITKTASSLKFVLDADSTGEYYWFALA